MRHILFSFARSKYNIVFCISVLLLLFALTGVEVSIHTPSAVAAPMVISTISVGSTPYGVGVNSSTNRIYVANTGSQTVSVIDGATNTVTSTITVGSNPTFVGVNSSTNRIYVTHNTDENKVSVIDGATDKVTSTITLGSAPWGVGVNSSTNRIYVTHYNSGAVSIIEDSPTTTSISGYIINKKGYPIESAKLRLKGTNSKILRKTISDENGLFEFTDLDADTYIITAIKKGYKRAKQTVTLEAWEERDIEIVMKKTSRRGK